MDAIPSSPTPKRTKSKAKVEAAPKKEPTKKAAAPAARSKKARVAPAPVADASPITVATNVEVVSTSGLTSTDLQHEIAMAAYFLAERRNFSPGHELDDWLQAERQVRETRAV